MQWDFDGDGIVGLNYGREKNDIFIDFQLDLNADWMGIQWVQWGLDGVGLNETNSDE